MPNETTLTKNAALTPKSDQAGSTVSMCAPEWFDKRETFKIPNASKAIADLNFTGDDLNFLARVLHAEASGSGSLKDEVTRIKEKLAIVHVFYNRLNVIGFDPNSWTKGKFTTFKGVATAVKVLPSGGYSGVQFESVIGTDGKGTSKFKSTDGHDYEQLKKADCKDFDECFTAIRRFFSEGPQSDLDFDNFRAAGKGTAPKGQQVIGGNRFWKMK